MEFPSKLLENLVYNISQLSGIGKRSALRIALENLKNSLGIFQKVFLTLKLKLNIVPNVIIFQIKIFVTYVQIHQEINLLFVLLRI